jgi:hypothetical protein
VSAEQAPKKRKERKKRKDKCSVPFILCVPRVALPLPQFLVLELELGFVLAKQALYHMIHPLSLAGNKGW